jgi:Protein of unknown function, DUF488
VELVVDVRSARSRRPLSLGTGLAGFRRPGAASPNMAPLHRSCRAYADYMATECFSQALARVLGEASRQVTAVMCAETLWWRCRRRLIADAATVIFGTDVRHLGHDGRLSAHRLSEGVRRDDSGGLIYDSARSRPGAQPPATRPGERPLSS